MFPEPNYSDLRDLSCVKLFFLIIPLLVIPLCFRESNNYALLCNHPDPKITDQEMKVFLGISLLSSYVKLCDTRMYRED